MAEIGTVWKREGKRARRVFGSGRHGDLLSSGSPVVRSSGSKEGALNCEKPGWASSPFRGPDAPLALESDRITACGIAGGGGCGPEFLIQSSCHHDFTRIPCAFPTCVPSVGAVL